MRHVERSGALTKIPYTSNTKFGERSRALSAEHAYGIIV